MVGLLLFQAYDLSRLVHIGVVDLVWHLLFKYSGLSFVLYGNNELSARLRRARISLFVSKPFQP